MFTIDVEWFKVWIKSRYPVLDPDLGVFVSFYSPHFFRSGDRPEDDGYSCALVFGIFEPGAQHLEHGFNGVKKELRETTFLNRYSSKHHQIAFTRGYHVVLLSVLPLMKIDSHLLIKYIDSLQGDYLDNSQRKSYSDRSPNFMIMPALDKTHSLLIQELCSSIKHLQLRPFYFKEHANNLDELVTMAIPVLRQGRVWVCSKPDESSQLRNMDAGMLEVISGYPSTQSTSMTWALCQAVVQLQVEGIWDKEYSMESQPKAVKLY